MKKTPERYILAAVLLALAITAGALAFFFPSAEDIVKAGGQLKPPAAHLDETAIDAQLAIWQAPPIWTQPEDKHELFISEKYLFYANLYPNGNYLQKDDGSARTAGGVLISWYQKYHLNFQDPNIDNEDPDGDGFSNKIEFMNEATRAEACDGTGSTDPSDPTAHPAFISRLRLSKFEPRPFLVEFRGLAEVDGVRKYQIYLRDVPAYKQPPMKKEGDDLGFEGYKVGKYTPKSEVIVDSATGASHTVDNSTLELLKTDINVPVKLIFRQETPAPEFTAVFVMLMPGENGKELRVPRAKTFVTSYEPNTTYLLLDASDAGAKIRNVATGKEYNIPRLFPAEWDDVPVPGTGSTPASTAATAH